ncbi:ABC transporter ATP-binding protein [Planctomycetota bacterium]
MIEVKNIQKSFGAKLAVKDLSFSVDKGELFVFLGPNGAGKTTTLKMITGLLEPDQGEITIGGLSIQKDYLEIKRKLGYIPDEPFLYEKLTGNEFLDFIIDMFGLSHEEIAERREYLTDLFEIKDFADTLTENYSHGMKQRLIFTAAFIHNPEYVVIDEPMVGLDPYSIRVVKDLLREEIKKGTTVLMSTHTLAIAEELADRVLIIHNGMMQCCETIGELGKDEEGSLEDIFLRITGREAESGEAGV